MSSEAPSPEEHVTRVATARWGHQEFFGGLSVAAVVAHKQASLALSRLGFENRRLAQGPELETLARQVERIVPSERLLIEAARYNKACKAKGGVVALIRWATERVVGELLKRYPECKAVVCEPFDANEAGLRLGPGVLVVMPGEGYQDVALDGARAVARWLYADRRAILERKMGVSLQGDARIIGTQILARHGEPALYEIAKMDTPLGASILAGGQA
ncbi:MAG: hypothetical protein HY303_17925 [Candidatus Wallbacteria bacterium]|nr:hypothetical protein [Candidatus Wallbacteria bacterium]